MKIAALILGLLGSLVLVGVGATWASHWNQTRRSEMFRMVARTVEDGTADAETRELVATAQAMGRAGNLAAALGLASLVASLLTVKLPRVAGTVMAVAVVVPSVVAPKMLLLGSLLALAAVLAFLGGRSRVSLPPAPVAVAVALLGLLVVPAAAQERGDAGHDRREVVRGRLVSLRSGPLGARDAERVRRAELDLRRAQVRAASGNHAGADKFARRAEAALAQVEEQQ